MARRRSLAVSALCLSVLAAPATDARLLEVHPVGGAPGQIIAAPPQVVDSVYASPLMSGFDERDWYRGVGTMQLHVHIWVWQPGDWIRVITGEQPVATNAPAVRLAEQPQ